MARTILGVSALVVRDGRILLVRRATGKLYGGRWSLPGGKVEPGEPLGAAARREVLEETGLRVEVGEVLDVVENHLGEDHYVIVVYTASVTDGVLRAGDDAEAAEFVEPSDARRRELTPSLQAVFDRAKL